MERICVEVPVEVARRLRLLAARAGLTLEAYLREQLLARSTERPWPAGFATLYGSCQLEPADDDVAADEPPGL